MYKIADYDPKFVSNKVLKNVQKPTPPVVKNKIIFEVANSDLHKNHSKTEYYGGEKYSNSATQHTIDINEKLPDQNTNDLNNEIKVNHRKKIDKYEKDLVNAKENITIDNKSTNANPKIIKNENLLSDMDNDVFGLLDAPM
jgi:uncharacterized protein involved in type VI secretion and phage assembly